jgi:hypothetical protein
LELELDSKPAAEPDVASGMAPENSDSDSMLDMDMDVDTEHPWNARPCKRMKNLKEAEHGVSSETWLRALELAHSSSSTIELADVVTMALRLVCKPEQLSVIMQERNLGETIIPHRSHCVAALKKLDMFAMLWERKRLEKYVTLRYPQIDASQQSGWNFLLSRAEEISFQKGLTSIETLKAMDDMSCEYRRRTMGLAVLGYGAATLPHKVDKFARILMNEGGANGYDQLRGEIEGTCTDRSTEHLLNDAPNTPGDLEAITKDIDRMRRQETTVNDASLDDSRMLPNSFGMADALHIVHKALEAALKGSPHWQLVEKAFRAIGLLLSDRQLRQRFRFNCCTTDVGLLFKNWSKTYVDWEFEFLGDFLKPLVPVLDYLIQFYSVARMQSSTIYETVAAGEGDEADADKRKATRKVIKEVGEAVDIPLLKPKGVFLELLANEVDSLGSWFEGCYCHEWLWTSNMSFRAKMAKWRSLNDHNPHHPTCMWKGKRLTEVVLGHNDRMIKS